MLIWQGCRTYADFQCGYLFAQIGNFVTQRRCLFGRFFFCRGQPRTEIAVADVQHNDQNRCGEGKHRVEDKELSHGRHFESVV